MAKVTLKGSQRAAVRGARVRSHGSMQPASPAGYIDPMLYGKPQARRDITAGNDGAFKSAAGWDACTGLGSPNGAVLPGRV